MSPFLGGSAPAMANQVAEGYTLLTAVQLKRLSDLELDQLQFELEKLLRDLRGQIIPADDIAGNQAKNRKIARLTNALQQVNLTRQQRHRRG
ncbi:MAG: hypothetical protein ACUVRE_07060 [Thermoanaerobaculaceae bacterium]